MSDTIPQDAALQVLDRAAQFRRQIAAGTDHPFLLKQNIIGLPAARITAVPDGWARVGTVADSPHTLDVWWHLATDRVRDGRPVERTRPAPAVFTGPPL